MFSDGYAKRSSEIWLPSEESNILVEKWANSVDFWSRKSIFSGSDGVLSDLQTSVLASVFLRLLRAGFCVRESIILPLEGRISSMAAAFSLETHVATALLLFSSVERGRTRSAVRCAASRSSKPSSSSGPHVGPGRLTRSWAACAEVVSPVRENGL